MIEGQDMDLMSSIISLQFALLAQPHCLIAGSVGCWLDV